MISGRQTSKLKNENSTTSRHKARRGKLSNSDRDERPLSNQASQELKNEDETSSNTRYRSLRQNNNDVERVDGRCLLKQNSGLKDENNSVGHRCTKNVIE